MMEIFLYNVFLYFIVSFSELSLLEFFLKKQKNIFRKITFTGIMSIVIAIYNSYWVLEDNINAKQYLVLMSVFALTMTLLFYSTFLKDVSLKVITLSFFVTFFTEMLLDFAATSCYNFLLYFSEMNTFFYLGLILLLFVILFLILLWLMKKISFEVLFEGIFSNKVYTWIALAITLFLALQTSFTNIFFPEFLEENPYLISGISLFIIIVLFAFFSFRQNVQHRIKAQEAMYLQQENYIQSLEEIQREMRMLQHDYKNVISGIYLQSDEGNLNEIKSYLESSILNIDNSVADKLKHTSNLGNIKIVELKSLLLIKLSEMDKRKIEFNLEVINPLESVEMKTEDLVRCLGILIDNAIDAVSEMEYRMIDLVLLDETESLTIMVKNPIQNPIEFNMIEKLGFSTKGENRGIGLYNYNEIIKHYPQAMKQTIVEDDSFKQVLLLNKEI